MMFRMKKTVCFVVLFTAVCFAQVNVLSDQVTFRNYNNANNTTVHYGDLTLSGGSHNMGWGWLTCNAATVSGYLAVVGDLYVYGAKNFVHPHPEDTTKVIKYIAIESGEALTLARGIATTVNGQVTVELPEHFSLVTSSDAPLTVILTPEKAPVTLYTKEKNRKQIIVGMKDSDYFENGDVPFAFQVTGVRDGFEDEAVVVDVDKVAKSERHSEKRAAYNKKVKKMAKRARAAKKVSARAK